MARRQDGWRRESHADRIIDPSAGPVIDCELAPVTAGQSRRVLQGQRPAPRLGRITRRIFTGRPYLRCQRLPPSRLRACTARMGVSKMPPRVSPCGIGFWARARSGAILQRILSHLGLPGTREGSPPPCSMTEIGGEHPALPGVTVYAVPWASLSRTSALQLSGAHVENSRPHALGLRFDLPDALRQDRRETRGHLWPPC